MKARLMRRSAQGSFANWRLPLPEAADFDSLPPERRYDRRLDELLEILDAQWRLLAWRRDALLCGTVEQARRSIDLGFLSPSRAI